MEYVFSVFLGYLLGSVNPAYIFGRLKGFDIRQRGTKSAGASNAKICLGWGYFIVTVIYDISKAYISRFVISKVFPNNLYLPVLAGVLAVLGHCFPFYLQFKGGKGFASFIGLSLYINFKYSLIIFSCGACVVLGFKLYRSGNGVQTLGFPAFMMISGLYPPISCLTVCLASFVILAKHKANFLKLKTGEEIGINGKKIGFGKKGIKKIPTIFLQTFLFYLTSSSISIKYCGNLFLGEEK